MKIVWICGINPYLFRKELNITSKNFDQHSALTWIHTLITEFEKKEGIELTVISSSYFVKKDSEFTLNGVKYFILKKGLPITIPKRFYNNLPILLRWRYKYFRKRVRSIVSKINPNIINCHGTENEYSLPVLDLKIPTIVEIQGFINEIVQQNHSRFLKTQLYWENLVFNKAKYFIIHTKYMAQIILNKNPDARLFICHYAVDKVAFELDSFDKDAHISFASNLLQRKGIYDLLDACKIVVKSIPDLRVKVIGRSTKENLNNVLDYIKKSDLERNIKILGYLPEHKDLLIEVKKSKVTVFPTYADTSPGTVGESMALGIPAISYNVGGLPDMIQNNISGILVEKGDILGLAKAIIYLLKNDEIRTQMGDKAKEFAILNWSSEYVVQKMLKIYTQVIKDSN